MNDREPYFCAACLAELPQSGGEEESCPKCDRPICCERDFLTEVQWGARIKEDCDLWDAAVRDGLIKEPKP